jgi:RNA polymerase sigma-70 factor (ECF subfamily)
MTGELDFNRLVETHYASLYRFAMSLARNENDACDLTQQTFYIWAAKGHQLQNPSKAKAWLFTTLHREFLESQRRRVRFPHHDLEAVEAELPVVVPDPVPGLDAIKAVHLLGLLDPAFQAPVALFYLEDYSYNEIAEILGIPLGTVKSRLSRGIAQLELAINQAPRSRPLKDQPHG